jgi:hypothetical protein
MYFIYLRNAISAINPETVTTLTAKYLTKGTQIEQQHFDRVKPGLLSRFAGKNPYRKWDRATLSADKI